jgi:hypothetical protein
MSSRNPGGTGVVALVVSVVACVLAVVALLSGPNPTPKRSPKVSAQGRDLEIVRSDIGRIRSRLDAVDRSILELDEDLAAAAAEREDDSRLRALEERQKKLSRDLAEVSSRVTKLAGKPERVPERRVEEPRPAPRKLPPAKAPDLKGLEDRVRRQMEGAGLPEEHIERMLENLRRARGGG